MLVSPCSVYLPIQEVCSSSVLLKLSASFSRAIATAENPYTRPVLTVPKFAINAAGTCDRHKISVYISNFSENLFQGTSLPNRMFYLFMIHGFLGYFIDMF
jgi:hypothetical protein